MPHFEAIALCAAVLWLSVVTIYVRLTKPQLHNGGVTPPRVWDNIAAFHKVK